MNANFEKISIDLVNQLSTRFPSLRKETDDAKPVDGKKLTDKDVRKVSFDFTDKRNGKKLTNVSVSLNASSGTPGMSVLWNKNPKDGDWLEFLEELGTFAKDHGLNFDLQNPSQSNLDTRDPIGDEQMTESRLFGTSKTSYQDMGEAQIIVRHTQPVNYNAPNGRTQHIDAIFIENSQGERFRYPVKHLNGARALAQHVSHGGTPYDAIGQHVISLSEELSKLRLFKNYVERSPVISENMGSIHSKVVERIDQVKKEVHSLQNSNYYSEFAEGFTAKEAREIPEDILNDWIDRLTVRSFNEELKTVFPFIYNLIDESDVPVKELNPDDLLDEAGKTHGIKNDWHKRYKEHKQRHDDYVNSGDHDNADKAGKLARQAAKHHENETGEKISGSDEFDMYEDRTEVKDKDGKVVSWKDEGEWKKSQNKDGRGKVTNLSDKARRETEKLDKKDESLDPLSRFESFMDSLVQEDDDLLTGDEEQSAEAMNKLKDLFNQNVPLGTDASNVKSSLQNIVDDDKLTKAFDALAELGLDEMDARPIIAQFLKSHDKENGTDFATKLGFDAEDGKAPAAPATPPPEAAAPEAPPAEAPPEAPPAEAPPAEEPAPAAPVAEDPENDQLQNSVKKQGAAEKLFGDIKERVSGFFNSNEGTMTIGEEGFVTKMCKELKEKYSIEPGTPKADKFDQMVERTCYKVMEKYKQHNAVQQQHNRMLELAGLPTNEGVWDSIKGAVGGAIDGAKAGWSAGETPKVPTTPEEIKAFQQANGLTADGIVGPKTLAAMKAKGIAPNQSATPSPKAPGANIPNPPASGTTNTSSNTSVSGTLKMGKADGPITYNGKTVNPGDPQYAAAEQALLQSQKRAQQYKYPMRSNMQPTQGGQISQGASQAMDQDFEESRSVGYSEDQTLARIIELSRR